MAAGLLGGPCAQAQTIAVNGLVDLRGIGAATAQSFEQGGPGLTRYGGDAQGDGRVLARLALAAAVIRVPLDWDLSLITHLRADAASRSKIDAVEAFLRWKPLSTGPLAFEGRLGAQIPRIALEETALAWTSSSTLTPSALASWIGEEVRALGGEGRLTWRGEPLRATATFGVFAANDRNGALLYGRGFALSDRLGGLLDSRVRATDVIGPGNARSARRIAELREIDDQPGIYAGLDLDQGTWIKASAFIYDNLADPRLVRNGIITWRTRFGTLGAEITLPFEATLLVQAMRGETMIEPGGLRLGIDFSSAYALIGRAFDGHRLALRIETFRTADRNRLGPIGADQRGHAITGAYVVWPREDLRFTLEFLDVVSEDQRRLSLLTKPRQDEVQIQTSLRYYFAR